MPLTARNCLSTSAFVTSIITLMMSSRGHGLEPIPTAHIPFLIGAGLSPTPNMLVQCIQVGSFVNMTELAFDRLRAHSKKTGAELRVQGANPSHQF